MGCVRRLVFVATVAALAASSGSALFRAADLVVIPVAAAIPGLNGSVWRSDLEILNVDSVPVDIAIILLPSEGFNNSTWYLSLENHLGGREEDGFGHVNPQLSDVPPGRSVILEDVVKTYWGEYIKGALLVFAYEAGTFGTTNPPGGVPRLIKATSRTYTVEVDPGEDEGPEDDVTLTFGQQIPGLPWYSYLSPSPGDVNAGFDYVVFTGIREDDRFRTALGLLNFSDQLTSIEVDIILKAQDGTVLREAKSYPLQPLSHQQFDRFTKNFFDLPADEDVTGVTVEVRVVGYSSLAQDPTPGLIAYISRIDNQTNDPVHVEQSFMKEMNWDCVFNGNCPAAGSAAMFPWEGKRRPVSLGVIGR